MMMLGQLIFVKLRIPLLIGIRLLLCVGLMCGISCARKEPDADGIKVEREFVICNVREYLKGNIRFRARPIRGGKNYSSLLIGTPNHPYNGVPPLVIRLPNGAEVDLTETSVEQLKKQGSACSAGGNLFFDIGSDSLDPGSRWPTGTERLQILPWWEFYVHDGRIISFHVYYRPGHWLATDQKPAIGAPKTDVLYKFPMSQNEVMDVFGRPDKIREYLEE